MAFIVLNEHRGGWFQVVRRKVSQKEYIGRVIFEKSLDHITVNKERKKQEETKVIVCNREKSECEPRMSDNASQVLGIDRVVQKAPEDFFFSK